ncbi:uncharacterized protein LOC131620099 [Vicia villosa]|uniref:uncharacterized protein LOC131620099 n=1 Tax=Vicia villosa TaxID=3911 RepID=UPI00273C7074|nr:uncharacterized protein LOC131620099 [Vicia villosa]
MQKATSNIEMLRMQALSILCTPRPFHDFSCLAPIQDKVDPCCGTKDEISDGGSFDFDEFTFIQDNLDPYCSTKNQINGDNFLDFEFFAPVKDKYESHCSTNQQIQKSDEENNDEREFSFACTDVQGMHIFADDIFENGKMRTLIPNFDQSLQFFPTTNNNASHLQPPLKKIFIKNSISPQSILDGISKETQNELLQNMTMKASSECYEKRNSTGPTSVWRFRQNLDLGSNIDNKESFVILNPSVPKTSIKPKVENIIVKKRKGEQPKNTLTAYEKLYVTNKARKGNNKRRSVLPYKHQLFGFFTIIHGLSRNLHPF